MVLFFLLPCIQMASMRETTDPNLGAHGGDNESEGEFNQYNQQFSGYTFGRPAIDTPLVLSDDDIEEDAKRQGSGQSRPRSSEEESSSKEAALSLAFGDKTNTGPPPANPQSGRVDMYEGLSSPRRANYCRETFSNEAVTAFKPAVVPKSPEEVVALTSALKNNLLFAQLDDRELQVAIDAMSKRTFRQGDQIIVQGDENEDSHFYFIAQGACAVLVDGKEVSTLKERGYFGELELLYRRARHCTVRAVSESVSCWVLDRQTYCLIMQGIFMRKREMYDDFLKNVGFLQVLTSAERIQLADALQPRVFKSGDLLLEYGEEVEYFYIIVEGEVEATGRDADGNGVPVSKFGVGQCVGELEFIYKHRAVADVRAITEVRTVCLDYSHFELCMGPIVELLRRNTGLGNQTYKFYHASANSPSIEISAHSDVPALIIERPLSDAVVDVGQRLDAFGMPSNALGGPGALDEEALAEYNLGLPQDGFQDPNGNVLGRDESFEVWNGAQSPSNARSLMSASRSYLASIPPDPKASSARMRRNSTSSEVISDDQVANFKPKVVFKSEAERRELVAKLKDSPLFSHVDDRELRLAIDAMSKRQFAKGQQIITQGEQYQDSNFYFIAQGHCVVIVNGREVAMLKEKDCFGELELMYSQPRQATVRALSDVVSCWVLDRETYRMVMQGISMRKRRMYLDFLKNVGFLQSLTSAERIQLADALQPSVFQSGDYLIQYGEEGQWFHILVEGVVEVIGRDADGKAIHVCEFGVGDCVGELEFIYQHRTVADVRAKSSEVRTARLKRAHFEMCMGPIVDVLKRNASADNHTYDYYNQLAWKSVLAGAAAAAAPGSAATLPVKTLFSFGTNAPDAEAGDSYAASAEFGDAAPGAVPNGTSGAPPDTSSPTKSYISASRSYLSAVASETKGHPSALLGRRRSMSSEVINEEELADFRPPVVPKSAAERAALAEALQDSPLFAHVDDRELQLAIDSMAKAEFPKGRHIITQVCGE